MADDSTLRMAAEILDRWSAPLKEMTKAVRNVSELTKKYHTEGERAATSHMNKYWLLRRELGLLGGSMRNILSPALAEINLGFGGIGASAAGVGIAIAAAIAAVKDFGKSGTNIITIARQTRLAKEQVLAWKIAADGLGVSQEAMNKSLKSFSALMDQTNRRSPYAFQRWQQMPGLFEALGGNAFTQMKDRSKQMRHAIDVIGQIPDADKRRRALSIIGLPEDIAGFTKEQLDRIFKGADEAVASGADKIDWEKAFDANVAFEKIGGQLDILKKRVQGGIVSAFEGASSAASYQFSKFSADPFGYWFKPDMEGFEKVAPSILKGGRKLLGMPEEGYPLMPQGMQWLKDWWSGKSTTPGASTPSPYTGPGTTTPGGAVFPPARSGRHSELEDLGKSVREGSYQGILSGLHDWQNTSAEGVTPASLAGGGGPGGFVGGGRHRMYVPGGDAEPTALHPGGGVGRGGAPQDDTTGAGLQGSDYLKARRSRFADELKGNPELKERLAALSTLEHEGDETAVVESLLNRQEYTGGTVQEGIGGGPRSFYGPVRRGMVGHRVAQLRRDPQRMSRVMSRIDAALAGSNLLQGATDQGSRGDPNSAYIMSHGAAAGFRMRGGEIYGDWGGGPGGHEGARRFRERQQRAIQGEDRPATFKERFDAATPGPQSSLIGNARQAGVLGNLNGSANIELTLAGFPAGLKSQMSAEGLFKDVKLNRGFTNNPASEDG